MAPLCNPHRLTNIVRTSMYSMKQSHAMCAGMGAPGTIIARRCVAASAASRGNGEKPSASPSPGSPSQSLSADPTAPITTTLQRLAQRLEGSFRSGMGGTSSGSAGSATSSPLGSFDPEEAAAAAAQAAREAFLAGDLGFGFSAGGLLFPFYCGVVDELSEMGILQEDTKMAGASAGSLIVACARSGLPMSTILEACYALADDCRANGTRLRLGPVLRGVLGDMLPADAAQSAAGRTYVAVTRVLPEGGPLLQPHLVSQFHNRDDLISALMTSCHIPIYMDGKLTTRFRGTAHFDGGITNFLPSPPEPSHTVRVCCLPSKQLSLFGGVHIAPDLYSEWPYSLREMLAWAFEPAERGMLEELVGRGREDTRAWARQSGVEALALERRRLERERERGAPQQRSGDKGGLAAAAAAGARSGGGGIALP